MFVNTSINEVCLWFQIFNGSTTNEVHLLFINVDQSLSYTFIYNDQLNFTECFNGIPAGDNWTVYGCDGPVIDCTSNPAAVIFGINITEDLPVSSSLVISIGLTTTLSTSTPSVSSSDHSDSSTNSSSYTYIRIINCSLHSSLL